MKAEEKLGMRPIPEHPSQRLVKPWDCDGWYEWLINEWLPSKGHEDMLIFVRGNFDPLFYMSWKLAKEGHFDDKPEFKAAVLETAERRKCDYCHGKSEPHNPERKA